MSSASPRPTRRPTTLPPGVLHPRRVMQGVVAGVRDYGNRMGIPTVNGAVYFDRALPGQSAGLLRQRRPDPARQVVQGGAAGRSASWRSAGAPAATASTGRRSARAELTSESETVSGGAVQIGNAITEKMVLDVLLAARDRGLYQRRHRLRGGRVRQRRRRDGREDRRRSVARPARRSSTRACRTPRSGSPRPRSGWSWPCRRTKWDELHAAVRSRKASRRRSIGRFVPTGRLELQVRRARRSADLDDGVPARRPAAGRARGGVRRRRAASRSTLPHGAADYTDDAAARSSARSNVASKEWIIRQYDHEVQGGSVVKPLVGVANDGPSDAAVVRPVLDVAARRGDRLRHEPALRRLRPVPHGGQRDRRGGAQLRGRRGRSARGSRFSTTSAGATTERPETLGSLVRAALACHDVAVALGTPFISGKDSLNNEFSYTDAAGTAADDRHSADAADQRDGPGRRRGAVRDDGPEGSRATCCTSSARRRTNWAARTSRWSTASTAGRCRTVDPQRAKRTFAAVHAAIDAGPGAGVPRPERRRPGGGAGRDGVRRRLRSDASTLMQSGRSDADGKTPSIALFSESNTRFVCEVAPENARRVRADARRRAAREDRQRHGRRSTDDRIAAAASDRRRHRHLKKPGKRRCDGKGEREQ